MADHVIDFGLGVEAADAEADARMGEFVADAEGPEHVARFEAGARAGGPAGDGHILDTHHEAFAFHVSEADVRVARQALGRVAVQVRLGKLVHDPLAKPFAEPISAFDLSGHFAPRDVAGSTESDDHGNGKRAGTHTAFVATAVDHRFEPHAGILLANVQSPDALRPVNLVGREAEQVDAHVFDVDGNLAHSLDRVGVKEDALFLAQFADSLDRLNGADFVVRGHDRDEYRFVRHRGANLLGRHLAELVHGQIRDLEAIAFEPLAGVEHGLVLGRLRDDVVALLLVHRGNALDGQVVALGRAARENNFLGRGTDQGRDLIAGFLDGRFRFPSIRMAATGGIPELLREVRQHGLDHARIDPRRGVVVHVNRRRHHGREFLRYYRAASG